MIVFQRRRAYRETLYEEATKDIPMISGPLMETANPNGRASQLGRLREVTIAESLGEGNFGTVYLGYWNGVKVAAKKLKGRNELEAFLREAELLE